MSVGTAANAEKKGPPISNFMVTLDEHIRAGYQVMYINTSEESRVEAEIGRVVKQLNPAMNMITWDCFEGFSANANMPDVKYKNPILALEAIADEKQFKDLGHVLFVFRDLDDYMVDCNVRRRIRSLAEGNRLVNKRIKRPILILSPMLQIHPKLRSSISSIEFLLPNEDNMRSQIDFVQRSIESKTATAPVTPELRETLAVNLLGLTSSEAENCLSRCIVRHGGFKPEMISTIKEEKAAIVRKSEVLTYIPEDSMRSRADIGGYDLYMNWLDLRKLAYEPTAKELLIDYPKGVALLGLPGTGKSMVAKATCMILGLPGYILDIGSLFGSMVGESEQRTRDVLKQIDAQKGCVLLIDEADKALGSAHTSQGDSGVTRRVFGTILTWLAENNSRTFTIMTLNRTDGLPPELTRAGRFDAMFYTDLPTPGERKQIIDIHFRRRNVEPDKLLMGPDEWKQLIDNTEGFVGSELEEVVRASRYLSYAARKSGTPTFAELLTVAAQIVPLTKSDPEGIEKIRSYCKDKAQPVTSPITMTTPAPRTRSRAVNLNN